jgi:predicted ATPase/predicted Ser/Thr protein kinase
MVGEVLLNRYKIEAELGKGGMGVVYKAHDALLDRVVAIKFLNAAGIGTSGKARLLAEARAAAKLNHPNIVSIFDAGEVDSNPFIVMELVEGKTLREYTMPNMAEALDTAIAICKALDHAHTKGIIHRDLKLENIIITSARVIKLMDFGLARTIDQTHLLEDGTIVGTFAYLAPELIQGEPASPQSDLYALGVVLYELLTGISPFNGTITEILSRHLHGKIQPPSEHNPNIPNWLNELVLQLLGKRREERPASAKDVLVMLEQQTTSSETTSHYTLTPKVRNNLPTQLTSFIGREKEIAEIKEELNIHRLVTLTGPGGIGKTRISVQVAADLLDTFPAGVWFVELASLTDPDIIPQTIHTTMGLAEQQGKNSTQMLIDFLHDKAVLIILDNCEHLIEASAKITEKLLSHSTRLKIIASSREALRVKGEVICHVPSLEVPTLDTESVIPAEFLKIESVRLFTERAAAVSRGFALDSQNVLFIAQICQRLDGMPLAIELAAARTNLLTVDQILRRLDNRFSFLKGGARTALPRHQTLHATIEWSYDLLSETERLLFGRLAVFVSGWTLDAAEKVCAANGVELYEILDLLAQLVNKSLVSVIEQSAGEETRYRMLETIKQFACERLVASKEIEIYNQLHAQYFLQFAEEAEPQLITLEQVRWFDRLELDYENLRAAFVWYLNSGKGEEAYRLGGALGRFWWLHGHITEGREWLKKALTNVDIVSKARAKTLYWAGTLAWLQGDYEKSKKLLGESIDRYRELGSKLDAAYSLNRLGGVIHDERDSARALKIFEECLTIFREFMDKRGIGSALNGLGDLAYLNGDTERARQLYEECLNIERELGDKWAMAVMLNNLGFVAKAQGNYPKARNFFEESLMIRSGLRDPWGIAHTLTGLAIVTFLEGQRMKSAKIQGAVSALLNQIGAPLSNYEDLEFENTTTLLKEIMGEVDYQEAVEIGKTLSIEQTIAYALGKPSI